MMMMMMSVQATTAAAIGSCTCDDPHLSHLYWYRCPIHCREASFPQAHAYINAPQHYQNQLQPHQALIDGGGNGTGADDDRLKQWLEDLTAAMLPRMVQERCYSKDDTHPLGSKDNDDDHHEMDYERLTSFLRYDNSFLTPWNWKPNCDEEQHDDDHEDNNGSTDDNVGGSARKNDSSTNGRSPNTTGTGGFMQFQPGSFSYYCD